MKHSLIFIFTGIAIFLTSCNSAIKQDPAAVKDHVPFPKGKKITNANFTGTAYLHMMIAADSLNPTAIGNVSFEPGARTKWHLHPAGQILLVTEGVGYYQEKGKAKQVLRKGDVVKCPPQVTHWHGASADTAFVQVAVTGNQNGGAVWFDAVSEEDYLK